MRELTNRAMAILSGSEDMIQRLHTLEISKGYCVSACNVAKLFGNNSIKGFYGVPEDDKKISRWAHECENKVSTFFEGDIYTRQLFSSLNVEEVHEFDWKCQMNRSRLDFAYDWKKEKPEENLISKLGKKEPAPNTDFDKREIWGKGL